MDRSECSAGGSREDPIWTLSERLLSILAVGIARTPWSRSLAMFVAYFPRMSSWNEWLGSSRYERQSWG